MNVFCSRLTVDDDVSAKGHLQLVDAFFGSKAKQELSGLMTGSDVIPMQIWAVTKTINQKSH
jgi:hypothetical protein